jgi:hypothetical protein
VPHQKLASSIIGVLTGVIALVDKMQYTP